MTHKLINAKTSEVHICDKVVIDGFDYYVSGEIQIASNNPSIDIPKVLDEAYQLAFNFYESIKNDTGQKAQLPKTDKELRAMEDGFIAGYKKAQEEHPYNKEDMLDLIQYMHSPAYFFDTIDSSSITDEEILFLWKQQKTQTIYFK